MYGASIVESEYEDLDHLNNLITQRAKRDEDLIMNIWKILRWQALLLIKSMSKEGIKEKDILLPDELEVKKTKRNDPERKKEVDDFIAKLDRHHQMTVNE